MGAKVKARMDSAWAPSIVLMLFMEGWKILMTPRWSPEIINEPAWFHVIVLMAESCAYTRIKLCATMSYLEDCLKVERGPVP